MNIFGSTYEEIGNLSANLVLLTAGKVKIRFGLKFIDLIDEKGNINAKIPKILNEVKSKDEMKSDGLYILDGDLYIYYKGNTILATGVEGHFIDYENNLKLSLEQINRAQNNIGLTFDSTEDALKIITQGIVFIEGKIYYINSNKLKELSLNIPLLNINNSDLSNYPSKDNSVILWKDGKWQYSQIVTLEEFNNYKKELEEEDQGGEDSGDSDAESSKNLMFDPIQYSKAYTIKTFYFNAELEGTDLYYTSSAFFETYQTPEISSGDILILSVEGFYGTVSKEEGEGKIEYKISPETLLVLKYYEVPLSRFIVKVLEDGLEVEKVDEIAIEKYATENGKYPDATYDYSDERTVKITRTESTFVKLILTFNMKYLNNKLYFIDSNGNDVSYPIIEASYMDLKYGVLEINGKSFAFDKSDTAFQGNHLYVKAEQLNPKKFRIDYNNAEIALEENYPLDSTTNSPKIIPHTVFGDMEDSKGYYNDPPISFRTIHDRDNPLGLYSDLAVFTGVEFRGKWPDESANLEVRDFPRYSTTLNNLLCSLEEVPEEYNQVIPSVLFIKHQLGGDYVISGEYVSEDKKIYLYKSGSGEDRIAAEIDTTDFIKDGMVSSVDVVTKTIEGLEVDCLVIIFNEDSGLEEIDIPLSKIFDSKLYYTKEEVDDLIEGISGEIPAALVLSDWSETDDTQPDFIKNKPEVYTKGEIDDIVEDITGGIPTQLQADWNESNTDSKAYIKNKPTIPDEQILSDWNQTDTLKKDYIQNKPDVYTKNEIDNKLGDLMPMGSIIMWAYSNIPNGWHICDGTVLSGNEYSDFINTLGPTLPDLRARFIVGINNNQGQTSVISSESLFGYRSIGGERTHTLLESETPLRDHKHYVPADSNFTNNWYGITDVEGRDGTSAEGGGWGKVMTSSNPIAPTGSSTSASAHNNLPPYYALFYIIKVKK